MSRFECEAIRRNDPDWPIDDMADLYVKLQKENPIVNAGGNRALNYEYGPEAWCIKITDTETGEVVGGCIFEFWNEHVDNCVTVLSAMVLPSYRATAVTHLLWKTLRWYALGCEWICTTQYKGNYTYETKYRRLRQ